MQRVVSALVYLVVQILRPVTLMQMLRMMMAAVNMMMYAAYAVVVAYQPVTVTVMVM
jgi:hypothetical protein